MSTATILTGPERRRRWTTAEKLWLVQESLTAGLGVAEFARQRDIHPNLIHLWRRQAGEHGHKERVGSAAFLYAALATCGVFSIWFSMARSRIGRTGLCS